MTNLGYSLVVLITLSLLPFAGINGQIAELDNMTSSVNATKSISVEEEDECSTKIGSAGMEFPYEKKTECEKQEWDKCIEDRENGIKWDDRCKDLNEGFWDDCEGYANKEECDEAWYTPPTNPPLCDEDTPAGQLCRDEGDPDSCEEGFVDRGNGCEPEDETELCPPSCEGNEDIPEVPDEGQGDQGEEDNDNDNGNNDELEPDQPEENGGSAGVPPFG